MKTLNQGNLCFALLAMLMFAMGTGTVHAEEYSDNPNLYGTWLLKSMQYEGEDKIECGKNGYTQIKYYGKDGEYACVEFRTINGKGIFIHSSPHEYGKPGFKLKDGMYSEMGRKPIKDAIVWVDESTTKGTWRNRHDIWKKVELPQALLDHILATCRVTKQAQSKEIQDMIKKHIMK